MSKAELLELLKEACGAIEQMPKDALGTVSEVITAPDGEAGLLEWPWRDELLDKINTAIAKAEGPKA